MSNDSTWPSHDGTSGIPEYLKRHLEDGGGVFPDFFHVQYDGESDSLIFMDQGGFIPTENEFWTMVDLLARAYRKNDSGRIEAHNRAQYERMMGERREVSRPAPKPPRKPEPGYVYVLSGGGYYKIGRAKDPRKRSETLAVQLPYETHLIAYVHTGDYKALELELHEHFAGKRVNGEWFDLSDEDLEYIKGLGE